MSSETRLVRPYVGGEEFQKMLDSCTLRCADEVVEGGGEVSVNLDEYLNYPFALLMEDIDWALAEAGATALELEPGDIDLLVLVAAPRLRFVDTIFRRDLSEVGSMPDHVPLSYPERPRALSRSPRWRRSSGLLLPEQASQPRVRSALGGRAHGWDNRSTESARTSPDQASSRFG